MQYNDLLYSSEPNNIKDYISDKYNIVHNQLYEDALHNYVYEYSKKIVMKDILYNLFVCMNNCLTTYNDINEIVNLYTTDEQPGIYIDNEHKKSFNIFSIEESSAIVNKNYITKLINYINYNCPSINSVFNELSITNDMNKRKYINYIVVNVISLMEDIKNEIIKNKRNIKYKQNTNLYDSPTFSDFIIRYNNSLYILGENNDLILFEPEQNNNLASEVFIYEEQYKLDFHIGFNKDGYFILDISDELDIENAYDQLYYIMSYINNLLLNLLLNDLSEKYIDSNTIIEKPNNEYYLPSTIIIYEKQYPHRKKIIDLSPYWSNYQDHSNINIEDIKYMDEKIKDASIENINYINGDITMYSKMHDMTFKVNKKYINGNTNVNDDLIKNTFTYIIHSS